MGRVLKSSLVVNDTAPKKTFVAIAKKPADNGKASGLATGTAANRVAEARKLYSSRNRKPAANAKPLAEAIRQQKIIQDAEELKQATASAAPPQPTTSAPITATRTAVATNAARSDAPTPATEAPAPRATPTITVSGVGVGDDDFVADDTALRSILNNQGVSISSAGGAGGKSTKHMSLAARATLRQSARNSLMRQSVTGVVASRRKESFILKPGQKLTAASPFTTKRVTFATKSDVDPGASSASVVNSLFGRASHNRQSFCLPRSTKKPASTTKRDNGVRRVLMSENDALMCQPNFDEETTSIKSPLRMALSRVTLSADSETDNAASAHAAVSNTPRQPSSHVLLASGSQSSSAASALPRAHDGDSWRMNNSGAGSSARRQQHQHREAAQQPAQLTQTMNTDRAIIIGHAAQPADTRMVADSAGRMYHNRETAQPSAQKTTGGDGAQQMVEDGAGGVVEKVRTKRAPRKTSDFVGLFGQLSPKARGQLYRARQKELKALRMVMDEYEEEPANETTLAGAGEDAGSEPEEEQQTPVVNARPPSAQRSSAQQSLLHQSSAQQSLLQQSSAQQQSGGSRSAAGRPSTTVLAAAADGRSQAKNDHRLSVVQEASTTEADDDSPYRAPASRVKAASKPAASPSTRSRRRRSAFTTVNNRLSSSSHIGQLSSANDDTITAADDSSMDLTATVDDYDDESTMFFVASIDPVTPTTGADSTLLASPPSQSKKRKDRSALFNVQTPRPVRPAHHRLCPPEVTNDDAATAPTTPIDRMLAAADVDLVECQPPIQTPMFLRSRAKYAQVQTPRRGERGGALTQKTDSTPIKGGGEPDPATRRVTRSSVAARLLDSSLVDKDWTMTAADRDVVNSTVVTPMSGKKKTASCFPASPAMLNLSPITCAKSPKRGAAVARLAAPAFSAANNNLLSPIGKSPRHLRAAARASPQPASPLTTVCDREIARLNAAGTTDEQRRRLITNAGRQLTNPIADVLTEGDDTYFVPIDPNESAAKRKKNKRNVH